MIDRDELATVLAEMIADYTIPTHLYGEPRDGAVSIWKKRILFKIPLYDQSAPVFEGVNFGVVSRVAKLTERVNDLEKRLDYFTRTVIAKCTKDTANINPLQMFELGGFNEWYCYEQYGDDGEASTPRIIKDDSAAEAARRCAKILDQNYPGRPLPERLILVRPYIKDHFRTLDDKAFTALFRVTADKDQQGAYHVFLEG